MDGMNRKEQFTSVVPDGTTTVMNTYSNIKIIGFQSKENTWQR